MINGVFSDNSKSIENRDNLEPAREKKNNANFFNPEATSFFGRLKEKAKNMVYRIYDGMNETPLTYRIIDRFKIAFNNFRIGRHEKKAGNLKKELESIDGNIGKLDALIAEIEQVVLDSGKRGESGAATLRMRIREAEVAKNAELDKRDKVRSRLEERENKLAIFVGRREQAANRLIGFYDRNLRPMENELKFLKSKKNELAILIEKEEKSHKMRLDDLEQQKEDMRQSLVLSGTSARAIRTDYVMRFMDDQIKKMQSEITGKKEQWLGKKKVIDEEIAIISRRSTPYQDKKEKLIRLSKKAESKDLIGKHKEMDPAVSLDENAPHPILVADETSKWAKQREKLVERLKALDGQMNGKNSTEKVADEELSEWAKQREKLAERLRALNEQRKNVATSESANDGSKEDILSEKTNKEDMAELAKLLAEEEKQKKAAEVGGGEERYKMARAGAWHTIYNVESYDELNAQDVEEGNQKFLERTRKLWKEIFVHENPDQDAKTCLELLKMAGIDTSEYKTAPQKKMREIVKSGVAMDFGDEDGVVVDEEGKLLILDHHGKKSDRSTSASRFVYKMLVEMGLLQKEEYVDKFIEFTTVCDNMRFSPEEMKQVYKNYSKNLYGLAHRMKPNDILELFKQGIDPMADLSQDYLTSHQYENVAKKDDQGNPALESLYDLSKYVENKMKRGEAELDRMEKVKNGKARTAENMKKNDFMVDTGDDRFGKVFIDMCKHTGKGNYSKRIEGANHSEQLAVFLRGYDSYLLWSPKEDSFVLYTRRKMDEESLPGGLSQGRNMRGHMWMKPKDKEGEPKVELKVTLEEIFSKLSGKNDFEGKKKLKIIASIDAGAKELLGMLYEKSLTEEEIKKVVKKVGVINVEEIVKNIASQMAVNKKHKKIDDIFRDKKALLEDAKKNLPEEKERILVEVLLGRQQ